MKLHIKLVLIIFTSIISIDGYAICKYPRNQINSLTAGGLVFCEPTKKGMQNTGFGTGILTNYGIYELGDNNSGLGYEALTSNTQGANNTAIGHTSAYSNTTGSQNTSVGEKSGYLNSEGSRNIFLGYQAGYNETSSDKLYISNSDTASPLIYGDFSSGEIKINGLLKTSTLQDANGVNMIRKVGDLVHIGANSLTIEDSTTTTSGKDEIGSTINDLQIGTGASHNTTIEGTLIVQTPTADGHATTKGYVDNLTFANTNSISANTNSISANTNSISANTNSIKDLSTGLAQSMAMASLAIPAQGRSSFGIGTGYYDGKSAIAYGFSHQNISGNRLIRILGASSDGITSGSASFSWGF